MGKKIFATVLAAVMLFSITGCHMVFTNEELDKEQVIAVVNGTEIKKETFLKDYQSYRTLYGITDANENSAANKEAVEKLKKQVFEELVSYEVIYQKAVELGVAELSDEQKQELDKSVETRKTGIRSSVEEEVELARRIKKGDRKALEKLTKANLRFVVSVAKQYQNQGLSLPDLINEGNIGLLKAAEKFDETRGFKFISYAVWWIRQSILQAIAEQSRVVRLPLNQVGSVNKINRILNQFEQENERRPSIDEIADKTDIPHDKIEDALKVNTHQVSVDAPVSDSDSTSMIDFMQSDSEPETDSELVMESLREEIAAALNVLNERERNVIEAFYGINQPERTMDEIGKRYGLTRERVRQIREKAIRKLKQNTNNKMLKAYLGK